MAVWNRSFSLAEQNLSAADKNKYTKTNSPREEIHLPNINLNSDQRTEYTVGHHRPQGTPRQQVLATEDLAIPIGLSKPRNRQVFCQFCRRQFGSASINIHEKRCQEIKKREELEKEALKSKKKNKHLCDDGGGAVCIKIPLPKMKVRNTPEPRDSNQCGLVFDRHSLSNHKKWHSVKNGVSDSLGKNRPFIGQSDVTQKDIVARVVTIGLVPGQCEKIYFHSGHARPETRHLSYSTLHESGHVIPSYNVSQTDASNYKLCEHCNMTVPYDRLEVHLRMCRNTFPCISTGEIQFPSKRNLLQVENKTETQYKNLFRPHLLQKSPTLVCYICGRKYGSKSIVIHEPQCLKKFNINNRRLPVSERLPLPKKRQTSDVASVVSKQDGLRAIQNSQGRVSRGNDNNDKLMQNFFEQCYSKFEHEFMPCKKCGRTFAPDRHAKHVPNCNAKPLKSET